MTARQGLEAVARMTRWGLGVAGLFSTLLVAAGVSRAQGTSAQVPAGSSSAKELSPNAVKEIQAILEEKFSRNPAQQKLNSHIHMAGQVRRGAVDLTRIPSAKNAEKILELDAEKEKVHVDIKGDVTDDVLATISALGGTVESSYPKYRAIRAWIPLSNAEKLAERPDVSLITPAAKGFVSSHHGNPSATAGRKPTLAQRKIDVQRQVAAALKGLTANSAFVRNLAMQAPPSASVPVDTNGLVAEGAESVQKDLAVLGAGVKIGVLSDGVNSLQTLVSNGELPNSVTVLQGQEGNGDEGTAMLEILYDFAPAAQLYFATATAGNTSAESEENFANNILALAQKGCNIIVDDIQYYDEPDFQDGEVAQAVNTVTSAGVLYFTAAGDDGNLDSNTSGVWEGDFSPGASIPIINELSIYSFRDVSPAANLFDPATNTNYDTVTSGSGGYPTYLQWSDPWSASCNDYDLFLLDSSQTFVIDSSTDLQNCNGAPPLEGVFAPLAGEQIVVVLASGAPRALHVDTFGGQLAFGTNGSIGGHTGAKAAFSVGAVMAGIDESFGQGLEGPEKYSSDGPRRIFFNPDGTAITPGNFLFSTKGGDPLAKPNALAADCGQTAVGAIKNADNNFCGSSASAPVAAAIAALVESANGALSYSSVGTTMLEPSNLLSVAEGFTSDSAGAGIMMADDLTLSTPAKPTLGSVISVLTPVAIASNPTGQSFTISGTQCRPGAYVTPWPASTGQPGALPPAYGANMCTITFSPTISTGVGSRLKFTAWGDGPTTPSRIITVPQGAVTFTADYSQQQYLATLTANPPAAGTVTANPVTADSPWYNSGAAVSVAVTANPGYQFANFSGDLAGTTNPGSLTVTAPEFVTANFNVSLTTQVSAAGGGTVTPPTGYFAGGSLVSLTATPDAGYAFASWTGNVTNASSASTTILLNDPQTVTANFNVGLTTQVSPVGGGTVSPGSGFYAPGSVVPVSAIANAGYTFSGWTGNVANAASASTSVTLSSPQTVTANFARGVAPNGNTVPNVAGDTLAGAMTAITNAGLVVGVVTQAASTTVASGDVISESPVAGTSVAAGSGVNLVISLGAPFVKIVPATSNPSCAIPACIVVDGSGNYDVTLYVTNQGNVPITLASITTAKLGTAAPTSSTTIANLAAGATGSFTLTFPASAGAASSNVALSVTGSYSATGASGNWSVSFRSVALP